MTLLLQYRLVLSGDPFSLCFCSLFVGLLFHYHLVMAGVQQMACKLQRNCLGANIGVVWCLCNVVLDGINNVYFWCGMLCLCS